MQCHESHPHQIEVLVESSIVTMVVLVRLMVPILSLLVANHAWKKSDQGEEPCGADPREYAAASESLHSVQEDINPNVTLATFPGMGRGLAAVRNFSPDDEVMQLPLTPEVMLGTEWIPQAAGPFLATFGLDDGMQDLAKLVIAVLVERHRTKGPWDAFFASLPRHVHGRLSWDSVHRRVLNSSSMARRFVAADAMELALRNFFQSKHSPLSPAPSDDDIRWAAGVVDTRAHSAPGGRALLPAISLANHHVDEARTLALEIHYDYVSSQAVSLKWRTRLPLHKGDQVFLSYGNNLTNWDLLVRYDFIVPGNPFLGLVPLSLMYKLATRMARRKFILQLDTRGPPCMDVINKPESSMRLLSQPAALPELLITCWRLANFTTIEQAKQAVRAGMFTSSDELPVQLSNHVLARDAVAMLELASECKKMKSVFTDGDPAAATAELRKVESPALRTRQVLHCVDKELASWDQCNKELQWRVTRIREALIVKARTTHEGMET